MDASGIADVDYSAGQALLDLAAETSDAGVRLVVADVQPDVRTELDRYGVTAALGAGAIFGLRGRRGSGVRAPRGLSASRFRIGR